MRIAASIAALGAALTACIALADDDAARGKTLFDAQCAACHTVKPGVNGFGPSLAGVAGREAGHLPGYGFTDAMKNSGLRWDAATLGDFLAGSTKKVPGTAMDVTLANPADRAAIAAYLATIPGAPGSAPMAAAPAAPTPPHGGPTSAELLAAGRDATNWLYATKDYAGTRFADLKQVNAANAARLRPVCIYRSDISAPTQTNPLVYEGAMYFGVENSVVSIDATTCRKRWEYKWATKGKSISLSNRGVAIKDGVLVRGTSDGYLIALNMDKGELLWSRKIAAYEDGQYLSMPPLMFEDLVIFGPAGADFGSKAWVGAFRIATGEPVWRFNLVPDDGEPGAETWTDPKAREHGGGSLWTPFALDPATGTVFVPVGNPAPDFYGSVRTGDNLYTNSVVALDVRTGKLKWYKQFLPHDVHDTDLTQVSPLFSAPIGGRSRNLMSVTGKDGLLHIMDRDTQEVLSELAVTTRTNVDAAPTVEGTHRCPGLLGGVEWNGPAYNPITRTLFIGSVDWCATFTLNDAPPSFAPGTHYYGGAVTPDPHDASRGWITAIDAVNGRVKWKKQWPTPMSAAMVATSGGVLFTGDHDNDFVVLDAANGNVLYRFNTGGSIGGGVITYEVKGKQYVATTSGLISGFHGGSGTSAIVVLGL